MNNRERMAKMLALKGLTNDADYIRKLMINTENNTAKAIIHYIEFEIASGRRLNELLSNILEGKWRTK